MPLTHLLVERWTLDVLHAAHPKGKRMIPVESFIHREKSRTSRSDLRPPTDDVLLRLLADQKPKLGSVVVPNSRPRVSCELLGGPLSQLAALLGTPISRSASSSKARFLPETKRRHPSGSTQALTPSVSARFRLMAEPDVGLQKLPGMVRATIVVANPRIGRRLG
jgi:hypothetical protein